MIPYRMMRRIWKSSLQSLLLKESQLEKEKIKATPAVSASFVLMPPGIASSFPVDTVLHAMHADQGRHISLLMADNCFRGSHVTTCMGRNMIVVPLLTSTHVIVTLAVQFLTFYVLSMHHDMGVLFKIFRCLLTFYFFRIAEEDGSCPICRRKMKKVRKIFTVWADFKLCAGRHFQLCGSQPCVSDEHVNSSDTYLYKVWSRDRNSLLCVAVIIWASFEMTNNLDWSATYGALHWREERSLAFCGQKRNDSKLFNL